MSSNFSIAVFNGDGIGPEIMSPTVSILRDMADQSKAYCLEFTTLPAGATHYAKTQESLPEQSLKTAREADAILLSAMGLPSIRYPDGTEISPQIELRQALNLFAGVRPVRIFKGPNSPLKLNDEHNVIDFVLVRESTEGLFSEKLFRFAFELAKTRQSRNKGPGKVSCIDKANVFRAFAFFRQLFDDEAAKHPTITADHAYVDATALWMVQKPWMFDVMVTENMFGDILSDLGAGLMGGLGLAPSADIGEHHAVFQPCHGTAPDIAGENCANPFAMILSAAMMLDWLGEKHQNSALVRDAKRLEDAVYTVIQQGTSLTADIGGMASTTEAANAVVDALR